MAISLNPDSISNNGGYGNTRDIRARCEIRRGQMELERASFISHWKDINDYIRPRRGRFFVSDVNKGDRRTSKIIDSTATYSARTLAAGMMSGLTSPARPWFTLSVGDQQLMQHQEVKVWLADVADLLRTVLLKSNIYSKLPIFYSDLGTFGTAAMGLFDDPETVIRAFDYPLGSFSVANDDRLVVDSFCRTFRYTVDQIVKKWGAIVDGKPDFARGASSRISSTVQGLWTRGMTGTWIDIVHMVQPNLARDDSKFDSRFKAFENVYYELGSNFSNLDQQTVGVLDRSGFDQFPILVGRWETNSEDVYGTDCPGMTALGDIKELQLRAKRMAQATEKMLNPPLTGPSALRTAKISLLPGDMTYQDNATKDTGLRPIHEVNFAQAFQPMEAASNATRQRIQRAFFEDLFLMMSQSDRREITAREIDERAQEKLIVLGPVVEQNDQDLLNPMISMALTKMERLHMLPPAPDVLHGATVHPEYTSIMVQAQKAVKIAGLDRFAGAIAQAAQADPTIMDNVDGDEFARVYADAASVAPTIIRSPEDVAKLRATRAQQQATQQAAANAPQLAGAAKDLSQADTGDGTSVLSNLLQRSRARATIGSTAAPYAQ